MYFEDEWDCEEDYLDSLKGDDHYHFSIPFEYIEKNYGNDQYDIAETTMEVDVDWSDTNHGYEIAYSAPYADVKENQGNSLDEIYSYEVYDKVVDALEGLGVSGSAICSFSIP